VVNALLPAAETIAKRLIGTRTIDILLEIMADAELRTRRRIQAAEAILGFESPPDAVAHARGYLATVFEDKENEEIGDRMDALEISRKFEAKKIAPQTVHMTRRDEADRREAWRSYEIRRRKIDLVKATRQHPPKGWDDDLRSPDYLPPPGNDWPPGSEERSGRLKLVYDRDRG
jgi:hypothetical protein